MIAGQQCFRTRDEANRTEPQELFIRWQLSQKANGGDPGQLNLHLSPARGGYPQLYLTQLLMNLPQAKMSELSDWLPDQWKIRHLARIPTFNNVPRASN
jgi:hypothetical protein